MSAGPLSGTITLLFQSEQVVTNGKAAEDTLKSIQTTSEKTGQAVEFNAKRAGLAMAGLTTSFVSTFYAAKGLEDMQLNVAKAHRRVEEAEQRLQKVRNDSKSTLQDIADAQRDVNIANEGYKQILDKVQEQQVMFVASLGTMAVTTIPSAINALRGLTIGHGAAAAAAGVQTAANGPLTVSILGLEVAMGPLILAILAGVAAFEGIAHVIKFLNPEIDITIENLSGLNKMWGAGAQSQKTQTDAISSNTIAVHENAKAYQDDLIPSLTDMQQKANDAREAFEKMNESLKKNDLNDIITDLMYVGSLAESVRSVGDYVASKGWYEDLIKDRRLNEGRDSYGISSGSGGYVIINGKAVPVGALGKSITHTDQMYLNKKPKIDQRVGGLAGSRRTANHGAANLTKQFQFSQRLSREFGADEAAIAELMAPAIAAINHIRAGANFDAEGAILEAMRRGRDLLYSQQFDQYGGLAFVQSEASALGIDANSALKTLQNPLTQNDIAGMVLYKQLSALAG